MRKDGDVVILLCYVALFSQFKLQDCKTVMFLRVLLLESWVEVPGSAALLVWLKQEDVLKRKGAKHLTTVLTLLLLEEFSKDHPLQLRWRIIYS